MTDPTHQYKKSPGYNVVMIRDFLKHLEWELRKRYFEHTQPAGIVNEEVVNTLAKYPAGCVACAARSLNWICELLKNTAAKRPPRLLGKRRVPMPGLNVETTPYPFHEYWHHLTGLDRS
jgi:hypothetical protein